MFNLRNLTVCLSAVAAAACGTTAKSDAAATGTGDDASVVDGALSGDSAAGTDAAADVASAAPACPTKVYKTLIVVGDSISDVGGSGGDQTPFYRTLLVENDDALYPAYKGLDLKTCWKLDPAADVVKVSKGGAIATESGGNYLLSQVKSISKTLNGPVLVVGTIGGNDVTSGLIDVVTGQNAKVKTDIAAFIKGFTDAMNEVTKADRFGAGVQVDVLMTNIYDPTGGSGDFTYTPENKSCGGMFAMWPAGQSTDGPLKDWNDAMATAAATYPNVHLLDMHAQFSGHQVNTADPANWFHDDCIHPNAEGQEKIRELFWAAMQAL
jgi:lysophospholipase L1-like esterase